MERGKSWVDLGGIGLFHVSLNSNGHGLKVSRAWYSVRHPSVSLPNRNWNVGLEVQRNSSPFM